MRICIFFYYRSVSTQLHIAVGAVHVCVGRNRFGGCVCGDSVCCYGSGYPVVAPWRHSCRPGGQEEYYGGLRCPDGNLCDRCGSAFVRRKCHCRNWFAACGALYPGSFGKDIVSRNQPAKFKHKGEKYLYAVLSKKFLNNFFGRKE